jgi:hypothetical protein
MREVDGRVEVIAITARASHDAIELYLRREWPRTSLTDRAWNIARIAERASGRLLVLPVERLKSYHSCLSANGNPVFRPVKVADVVNATLLAKSGSAASYNCAVMTPFA